MDAYIKEFEATAVSVSDNELILDKTAFYPTGGGQPNDTGRVLMNGAEYEVVDVKKRGEDIIHMTSKPPEINVGDTVKGVLDWQRRYTIMRYHTAVHLIDAIVEKHYGSGKITGGQIYSDRAHFDIDMQGLNKKTAQEIIDKTNEFANEAHNVISKEISREEALGIPNVARTAPGSELMNSLDTVRVVEIVGIDVQADGGTHVRNTSEIGVIRLADFENKGTHRKRIEIVLG